MSQAKALCVDLDGTLIKTDLLYESLVVFCRQRWWHFLLVILWMIQGRAYLKRRLAQAVDMSDHSLPFHDEFLEWLLTQKHAGRKLVLVTASDQQLADMIAKRLPIFDEVHGSDGLKNLKSSNKAAFLKERFGDGQFDYAGNSSADWQVWQAADHAIVVEPTNWVRRRLQKLRNCSEVFHRNHTNWKSWLKSLRVHQYAKNCLIAVPLVAGHKMFDSSLVMETLLGVVCFSLLASSVYLVNDILDLDSDRRHHSKSARPIAAGELPINHALVLVMVLLTATVCLAYLLPIAARWVLLSYFLITQLYSFYFKKILLVDVLVLASLYTLRIFFGATILQTPLSEWLLLFSMFSFLSLAFVKRYNELMNNPQQELKLTGRGYHAAHLSQINIFGISSGYLAALVFALYSNSANARSLYQQPQLLWLVCPLIIYWISRVWLLAGERKLHDDPVVFAIKDRVSYVLLILVMLIGGTAYLGVPL